MTDFSPYDRFDILNCKISTVTIKTAMEAVIDRIKSGEGGYVCFSNVHTVVTSKEDLSLRESTNNSFLSMPDGKPLSVYARLKGYTGVEQVAGPDFMPYFFQNSAGVKHYFYGSTPETLNKLISNFSTLYPKAIIAGSYSPPFRELTSEEINKNIAEIKQSGADVVWVGLGAPKQECWMAEHWQELKPAILMGVGAAFDFHAGVKPRAPEWMKKSGLEWLHRLLSEPGRLWKRYLVTNTKFVFYLLAEVLLRKH